MNSERLSGRLAKLALLGAVGTLVSGATLRVPSEYKTINSAIDAAVFGDVVLVAPGIYVEFETRIIQGGIQFPANSIAFMKAGVSLVSEAGPVVTSIDLQGKGQGTSIPVLTHGQAEGDVILEGFTVTGAPSGSPGMWALHSDRVIVRDCVFRDLDSGPSRGAGIQAYDTDLEVVGCQFRNCVSSDEGGAVSQGLRSVLLEDCVIEECSDRAVAVRGSIGLAPDASVVIRRCHFEDNTGISGGAITTSSCPRVIIEECTFVGNTSVQIGGALDLEVNTVNPVQPYELRGNLFLENHGEVGGAVIWFGAGGVMENNTYYGNTHDALGLGGAAFIIESDYDRVVEVRNNIISGSGGGPAVASFSGPPPISSCNDFWDNADGDFEEYEPGPSDLFVSPEFCDVELADFSLSESSPCQPENSGSCGLIGAFGVGCGTVSVEAQSWGKIKARYHEGAEGVR